MKRISGITLVAVLAAYPATAGPHYGRTVAAGVAVGVLASPPPFPINTGPVSALVPGGSPEPTSPAPVADELAKMASLRDKGIISDAEFQQQKGKLLEGPQ